MTSTKDFGTLMFTVILVAGLPATIVASKLIAG